MSSTFNIKDKTILVTGAAGSIGSELCRQILRQQPRCLVALDMAESPLYMLQCECENQPAVFVIGNITDSTAMERIFTKYHPDIVFHAAAYKHVPLMEEFPYEAVKTNVFGSKILIDLAVRYDVERFVMISTDKAVRPSGVMGATKRIAEMYVAQQKHNTIFITTRFGNVLASNGSVVPLFRKQIADGGPVTVTDKRVNRYFMTIDEACTLVLEAVKMGQNNELFFFDMGAKVNIYEFAQHIIAESGKNIPIKITGLRQGEKLDEELLIDNKSLEKTENPKIFKTRNENVDDSLDAKLQALEVALHQSDDFIIVEKIKSIVKEFKSNNSRFVVLDKS